MRNEPMVRKLERNVGVSMTTRALGLALALASCTEDKTDDGGSPGKGGAMMMGVGGAATPAPTGMGGAAAPVTGMTINVAANITANTTWIAGNTYALAKETKISVKSGATLKIEAGAKVCGNENSALVITRGAKIDAVGTKDKVVLFTSCKPDGMKAAGDWGGLILMGKAPVNVSRPMSEEGVFEAYGQGEDDGKFGGNDAADSSGTLKYVRIEFGGTQYLPDREWNNLTLCGVGSGTSIDFVQSHAGADDGVELFGGTVNVKHLVLSQNEDDGFDTDNGWNGKGQFIVIQHNSPKGTDASNGYESDNHAMAASYDLAPRTSPTLYNVTLIGKRDHAGTTIGGLFRRGSAGKYYNHIWMNFKNGVIEVRDVQTKAQFDMGALVVKNSVLFESGPLETVWPNPMMNAMTMMVADTLDEKASFDKPENMLKLMDPMLGAPLDKTKPDFKPKAGSPALTGGATPPSDGFFDDKATFMGGVGGDDWSAGWTAYPAPKP